MRLSELSFSGWRNLEDAVVQCDAPLVILEGDNGQGKSNLLEAVHVLANLKSFREPRTRRWLAHGENAGRLSGNVQTPMGQRQMVWRWVDGVRKLQMDGAAVGELSTWFETIRAIVFCPEDGAIVRGEPERRRKFMDRAAFNAHPAHLSAVMEYRKILGHKRALLQQVHVDPHQLDAFDVALARTGALVVQRRLSIVSELRTAFSELHADIALHDAVDMNVVSNSVKYTETSTLAEIESLLFHTIGEKRHREIERRQVLVGPHRDDLALTIGGYPARNFASQGQARSIVLSLKLAEFYAAQVRGDVPLFLLDDVTSELDMGRRERLVDMLATLRGQVWVTTTDSAYLGKLTDIDHLNLRVQAGRIRA